MTTTTKPLVVFGDPVDDSAVVQIETCLADSRAVAGALMADHHRGYSMPIGGVVAYDGAISPSGVGYDIACGNKAVRTSVNVFELGASDSFIPDPEAVKPFMREIQKRISFGLKRSQSRASEGDVDHELFDSPVWKAIDDKGEPLKQKARAQLGTVGSGNHYVDLLADESGHIWIANHFGSRGLGHTIATMFMKIAYGIPQDKRLTEREDPALLDVSTDAGATYLAAMELAGQYAYAGRDYVVEQVLGVLGNPEVTMEVHNHHNFAWLEDGNWVVRKGATPLTPEPAFIGASMGGNSVIVKGQTGPELSLVYDRVRDIGALGSAPHGAGRVMSRTEAAGKLRKMWYCNNRNCDFPPERSMGDNTTYEKNRCPKCGLPLRKGRMRDTSSAKIDWAATRVDLASKGIVVLGSGADEAPGVYKDLQMVLNEHSNIEILHSLRPIGVVMASPDELDPYKD